VEQILGKSIKPGETGDFKWKLPEKLMPFQGCIFWWRELEEVVNTVDNPPQGNHVDVIKED